MDPIDDRLTRAGTAWRATQPPLAAPTGRIRRRRRIGWVDLARVAAALGVTLVAIGVLSVVSPRGVVAPGNAPAASPQPGVTAISLLTTVDLAPDCRLRADGGMLVRDPSSGLGLRSPDGAQRSVRWPAGYRAFEQGGRAVLVDPAGIAVAVDGDQVGFGDAGAADGIGTACAVAPTSLRVMVGSTDVPNKTRPMTMDELIEHTTAPDAVGASVVATTDIIDRTFQDPASGSREWGGAIGPTGSVLLVTASRDVAGRLPENRPVLHGTWAFSTGPQTLALLGPVTLPAEGLTWDPESVQLLGMGEAPIGAVLPVAGWLRLIDPDCGIAAARWAAPRDLSSDGCEMVGIAERPQDPASGAVRAMLITVEPGAWDRFGTIPGVDVRLPRHGVWLVRRTAEPTPAEPHGEWEVVGRLPG